ncbi:MAG: hypothetical protein ACUZ9M_03455 [Candidatus Scalindua sp.]
MPLYYRWHVDKSDKAKPFNGKAMGITEVKVVIKQYNPAFAGTYKDWQPYKDYLRLPEGYRSPAMEKSYKDSFEAEQIVKNLPCTKGGTLDQYFSIKPKPPLDDLGWNEFPGENGIDVVRTFLLNPFESLKTLEYRWHVDSAGKVTAINDEAYGITKWGQEDYASDYKTTTINPSGKTYEVNSTVTLHDPTDTSAVIYRNHALTDAIIAFTNGIDAKIIDYKSLPDKPVVYKVRVDLLDGSVYTGWIPEGSILD